jgi:hypothetical protein
MRAALFCLGWLLVFAGAPRAAEPALTREQQLQRLKIEDRQLLLEQRRALLESHRRDLQAAQDLRAKSFLSAQKYRQLLNSFQEAQLNYDQAEILLEETKMELLKNAIRLAVVEARKYPSPEGRVMVDIALENQAEVRDALLVNPAFSPEEARTLLRVENIYVALLKGPIVGEPYELHLPSLEVGETRTLTFHLLQEAADIAVSLRYLDVRQQQPILFKKNPTHALPAIDAAQFSLVGELGREVLYDLSLKRSPGGEQSFALALLGLPPSFAGAFVDQGVKVSQVKFADQTAKARLSLEIELPTALSPRLAGQSLPFYALVTVPAEYARINALQALYGGQPVPEAEVRKLKASYVRLELIPKGMGRLELLVDSHVLELETGENAALKVDLVNRGSAAVREVRPALLGPPTWTSGVAPEFIPLIGPGQRLSLSLLAQPTGATEAGDHEFLISAQGQVGAERVEAPEEHLTIHVSDPADWTFNLLLVGALAVLVGILGLLSLRLARN